MTKIAYLIIISLFLVDFYTEKNYIDQEIHHSTWFLDFDATLVL